MEESRNRPRRTCVVKQQEQSRKEHARFQHAAMDKDTYSPTIDKMETACNDDTDVNIEPTEENENNPQTPSKRENGFALPSVGREMYSFGCVQSPSVKVASAIRTPSIRLRRPTSSQEAPSSRTPSSRGDEYSNSGTPSSRTGGRKPRTRLDPITPRAARRNIAARLGKSKEETLNNYIDSEDSEDDDENYDDEMLLEDDDDTVHDYFNQSVRQRAVGKTTSDHTLAKLGASMLNEEQIAAILKSQRDTHAGHREKILKTLSRNFSFWLQLAREGSNLLLYGLGSKVKVLSNFVDYLEKENYTTMVVHGFLPTCGLQEIVTNILEYVIEERPKGIVGLQAQVDFICAYFARSDALHLFLLVNSIDSPALTNPRLLQVFETLACAPRIHFVGSVNHINAPLLYDLNRASAMRWVWIDATTYEPYVLELFSESLKSSTANTLSSLEHVFASLTANAKKVFMIIANYTLERCSSANSSASSFRGMAFQDCYRMCREAFVVNSDLTLRTQLTEFVDHDMVRIKKGHDGVEYLIIPLAKETLEIFVQQQEESC